ncbi:hypothetical protein IFM89_003335 [Coptis chinensis]|uniref:Uncharacterized protein n=1 Tax=Coptis chinensis TaxID=261450 RepID=A0A835M8T7_9MAGN|nr:hypothetical protein IFM89_003335 [Coptis chinensis]
MTLGEIEKLTKETQHQVNEMQGLMTQVNDRLIKEIQAREVAERKMEARLELSNKRLDARFDQLLKIMNDKGKNTTVAAELPSGSGTPLETTTEAEQSTTYSRQKIPND